MRRQPPRLGNPMAPEFLIGTHETGWRLYLYRTTPGKKPGETWHNIKLVGPDGVPVPVKANYWLAYCVERLNFTHNEDLKTVEERVGFLLPWMEKTIVAHVTAKRAETPEIFQ